jgi:hypothetical protein
MHEHSDMWLQRMKAFLYHCRASLPWEEADRIRDALKLKRSGSRGQPLSTVIQEDRMFEALIAEGAMESAALDLIGEGAEFGLSGGQLRAYSARVRLPGQDEGCAGEGGSVALALLAAWAAAQLTEAGCPYEKTGIEAS